MTAVPSAAFTPAELADWLSPATRWSRAVAELHAYGAERRALAARLAVLEGQLADPDLVRTHPQDALRATERRERWKNRMEAMEDEAGLMRLGVASLYHRLPAAERRRIAADTGEAAAPRIAAELWRMATAGDWPAGWPPF